MTKLLGLRIGEHDSNLSYFDGKEVHYIKYERKFQIKHYRQNEKTCLKKPTFSAYVIIFT